MELSGDAAAVVAELTFLQRRFWNLCMDVIAEDPWPRHGSHAYRFLPAKWNTFVYEINEEASGATGLSFYTLIADCLPDHCPVYAINERERRVLVLLLRRNRRY